MPGRKSISHRIKDTFRSAESDYPLHASICKNDLSTMQEVLGSPEAPYLLSTGDGRWGTPLHVAVYLDNIKAVNRLLQAGADVTAESSTYKHNLLPLALAVRVGNQRLLWRLWQHLNLQKDENEKNVDLCLFQALINSQITVLRALLTWKEWTTEVKNEALLWAARSWKVYSAQLLTSEWSFCQDILDQALHCAVDFKPLLDDDFKLDYNGDDYLQQQLLIAHLVNVGANPNTIIDGRPPIIIAARHIDLVGAFKVLLDKGANPDATDHKGKTALHFLGSPTALHQCGPVVRLNETAIRILLEHKPSVLQSDNKCGANPLHAAAFGSNLDTLQSYLSSLPLEQRSQALGSKNNYDETLLHYASAGAKCDIVEFLLSQGLDVNGPTTNSWTPLHCALTPARRGSQLNGSAKSILEAVKISQLLLFHGADPHATTAEGWTPLHCLSLFGGKKKDDMELNQFVDSLIHRGVDVNARATFIFWNELGDIGPKYHYWGHEVYTSIQDPEASGAIVRFGYSPIHFAAANGNLTMAKTLLSHGADPLSKDERGNTAIKIAANSSLMDDLPSRKQAIVQLLTEAAHLSQS
ncbi:ankyrin repeat [Fusarium longipes]|uniref:Ankyrin repeat n=1 Tax=Fusarium longipes TaxID=694270 RepID=A0A395T1U2_9HYPO|nr:ankyrin repeat [Fusarium longipes]